MDLYSGPERDDAGPMSTRDRYPAGVPCWVETLQPDVPAAIDFYGSLFGWEFADPEPMPSHPAGLRHIARLAGHDVAGIGSALGGTVIVPVFDNPGFRRAVLADPQGATFTVTQQTGG